MVDGCWSLELRNEPHTCRGGLDAGVSCAEGWESGMASKVESENVALASSKRKRVDSTKKTKKTSTKSRAFGKSDGFDLLASLRLQALSMQNGSSVDSCTGDGSSGGVYVMLSNMCLPQETAPNLRMQFQGENFPNGAYVQRAEYLEDLDGKGLERLRTLGADGRLFGEKCWSRCDSVGSARCITSAMLEGMGKEKPGPLIPAARNNTLGCVVGANGHSVAGRNRPNALHLGKASTHQALPRSISKMGRFVVRRSGIAELGIYTTEDIAAKELLMEYVGEVVRREVAELRERKYMALGLEVGCYLFSLGPDWVIDATRMGNMARYINHSCEPNCAAQLVTPGGKDSRGAAHNRRVFVYAKKNLIAGEELSYDYKLSTPDVSEEGGIMGGQLGDSKQIRCNCGAKKCRGYL